MNASPLHDLSRQLRHYRHGAAAMRKRARVYAENGADWLAADAARRARFMRSRARSLARVVRVMRTIATSPAANV